MGERLNKKYLAVIALGTIALSGCSTDNDAPASTSSAPAATEKSAQPTPDAVQPSPTRNLNERGELVKELGETGGVPGADDELDLEFKVTGFEFTKCSENAPKLNGKALAVHLEVKTSADFEGPVSINGVPGFIDFTPYHWRGYDSDGTRMNEIGSQGILNCFDSKSKLLPDRIGKGEKAKGIVLLDVTSKTGEVVFDPYGDGGWVWKFPATGAAA